MRRHNGLVFSDLGKLSIPVVTTMTISVKEKLMMKGEFVVECHSGSYKYNDEVVLVTWSHHYPHKQWRAPNIGYARVETVFPGGLREARDFFFSVACELDAKLKGVGLNE